MQVFTYGSLMFDPVWRRVVRGRYRAEPASVEGLQRGRLRGESYPGLWPGEPGDRVVGVLYRDVGRSDLVALDRFEGEQYQRRPWICRVGEACLSAELYLLSPAYRRRRSSRPWDPEWFARQGLAQFLRPYRGFRATPPTLNSGRSAPGPSPLRSPRTGAGRGRYPGVHRPGHGPS